MTITSSFIDTVCSLAAESTRTLEIIPPPEGSGKAPKVTQAIDLKLVDFIEFIQGSWSFPAGLQKEGLKPLMARIRKEDWLPWIFKIHIQARARLEIPSGTWDSMVSGIADALQVSDGIGGNARLLDLGELSSLVQKNELTNAFKSEPWLVTLVALALGPRLVFTEKLTGG